MNYRKRKKLEEALLYFLDEKTLIRASPRYYLRKGSTLGGSTEGNPDKQIERDKRELAEQVKEALEVIGPRVTIETVLSN